MVCTHPIGAAHETNRLTDTVNDYDNGEDIGVLRSKFMEAARTDDTDRIIVWAGSGVGLMNKIQPAKVIHSHNQSTIVDVK